MAVKLIFCVFFTSAIALTGCSLPDVYISSMTDNDYRISKDSRIAVFCNEEAGIEERNFHKLLVSELQRNGFNVTDPCNSEFVLLFTLDEKTRRIDTILPMTNRSHTYGSVGGYPYHGTTRSTTYVPYSYNYTVKKVYMWIHAVADLRKGKKITVWEGYIGADKEDFRNYPRECVSTLLKFFGENYQAHIALRPIRENQD